MNHILPAAVLCLVPYGAQAQSVGASDLLCVSVGGDGIWTQIALYGGDNHALVMAVPPDGVDEPMESRVVMLPDDAFAAMAAVLRRGLADLPPPPSAEACDGIALGPIAIALHQGNAAPLRYAAPCPTEEVLALGDALIEATGDPTGEPLREWTSSTMPAMHDICETLP